MKEKTIIENNVTIYVKAWLYSNVHIGYNLAILSGYFVNFDAPSNTIVIDNPREIHYGKMYK